MFKRFFRRWRTADVMTTDVLTTEKIGPKREKTPEGFLLCRDVPVARTGMMIYGPGETPIKTGSDGVARVHRTADDLFAPDTLASFQGKPVVNEHPTADVTPRNWKELTTGIILNPRRGKTEDATADVMVCDLLITDAETIRDVNSGKREVSAGYEADYEQTGEGEGRQTNIIGNHVALVDRGRCGPRCAIGDHEPSHIKEHSTMGTRTIPPGGARVRKQIPEAVRQMFRDAAAALADGNDGDLGGDTTDETLMDPTGGGDSANHTHIHIHTDGGGGGAGPTDDATATLDDPIAAAAAGGDGGAAATGGSVEDRLAALEGQMSQLMAMLQGGYDDATDTAGAGDGADAGGVPGDDSGGAPPAGDEDDQMPTHDRAKTGDSAALETSFRTMLADAEVLFPGFRMPTFDGAATRQVTLDGMCATRRKILEAMYATTDGKTLVDSVAEPGFDPSSAGCAAAAVVFRSAAGAKRLLNNNAATKDASSVPGRRSITMATAAGSLRSLADLNERNKAFWAGQNKTTH